MGARGLLLLRDAIQVGHPLQVQLIAHHDRGGVEAIVKYVDDEQAIAELRDAGMNVGDNPTVMKFKTGKFDHQWKSNVACIGLAGGFLEPLEAATIHMMCGQIKALTELFLPYYSPRAAASLSNHYNQMFDLMYRDLVDFISIHYHADIRCGKKLNHASIRETSTDRRHRSRSATQLFRIDCRGSPDDDVAPNSGYPRNGEGSVTKRES